VLLPALLDSFPSTIRALEERQAYTASRLGQHAYLQGDTLRRFALWEQAYHPTRWDMRWSWKNPAGGVAADGKEERARTLTSVSPTLRTAWATHPRTAACRI
jgi:hypothetical protein